MRGLDKSGARNAVKAFAVTVVVLLTFAIGCEDANHKSERLDESSDLATRVSDPVFKINGKAVQLNEVREDGTVSLLTSVTGDLNKDGRDDRAVILILNSVGSGVFYHLNVFLDDGKSKWRFVGEEFLGDRIRFDFLDIYAEGSVSSITGIPIHPDDYGKLVVAFSVRSSEQSFAEEPSLYLTRHWKVEDGRLVLIEDY